MLNFQNAGKKRVGRKQKIAILFLFISFLSVFCIFADTLNPDYAYDKDKIPETYFFPLEYARWDGYEVLNTDWKFLDIYQKSKFIAEATNEIEFVEGVKVTTAKSNKELVDYLDEWTDFFTRIKSTQMVITILLKHYYERGEIKGELISSVYNHPFLTKKIALEILGKRKDVNVEIGKTYEGYITCYKQNGEWLSESEEPRIGEIKKGTFFFAKRFTVPSGATVLTEDYPLDFNYKIIAFREINSFIDTQGIGNYYYKVIFEAINKY
ncbi:MAG: hypothetical protein NT060_01590 [Candidatus Omnitrophica bacterium]|nr:hypothetical protein [Candidatus Omnitrophota bacterium]